MDKTALHLGFPIALLVIAIATFIFVGFEIKKKRLEIKEIIFWFILNTLFMTVVIYILIVQVVRFYHPEVINGFNWVAENAFGISFDGQEWILLMIFGFISFVLISVMINTVRIQRLNKRIDELNKEVAILSGKVNKTANFNQFAVAQNEKTLSEIKKEIRAEVKIAKARRKAKDKIKELTTTQLTPVKKTTKSKKK